VVLLLIIGETDKLPTGYAIGGMELIYDQKGPVFEQTFYSVSGNYSTAAVERIPVSPAPAKPKVRSAYQRPMPVKQQSLKIGESQTASLTGRPKDIADVFILNVTQDSMVQVQMSALISDGAKVTVRDASGETMVSGELSGWKPTLNLEPIQLKAGPPASLLIEGKPNSPFYYQASLQPLGKAGIATP
jgi:hypothetical protein